jgi:hypothetical protein
MVPGKVENWTNIFDFKGVGLTQIPKKVMKGLNRPMQDYFKGRLYRMHVLNAQWAIKILYKMAKKMVDPFTLSKFVVCEEKDTKRVLSELIDLDNIEKRFGGNLPDKTDSFFPPDLL